MLDPAGQGLAFALAPLVWLSAINWLQLATTVIDERQKGYILCFSLLPSPGSSVGFRDNKVMFIVHQLSCSPKFQSWNTSHVKELFFLPTGTGLFTCSLYETPSQSLAIGSDREITRLEKNSPLLSFKFF